MPPEIFEGRCFDSPNPLQYAVAFVKDCECTILSLILQTLLRIFFVAKMYMYPLDGSIELRRTLAHINFFDRKTKEENDGMRLWE